MTNNFVKDIMCLINKFFGDLINKIIIYIINYLIYCII